MGTTGVGPPSGRPGRRITTLDGDQGSCGRARTAQRAGTGAGLSAWRQGRQATTDRDSRRLGTTSPGTSRGHADGGDHSSSPRLLRTAIKPRTVTSLALYDSAPL